jgi:GT2 family glycosyltransferase
VDNLRISVLITTYNSWDIAMRCVNANLELSGGGIETLVVVDDHSDESYSRQLDSKVQIVRNAKNLGYASSLNVGIHNLKTDIIVVMDADAYPLSDYSDTLLTRFAADEKLGLLGFTTYDRNNHITSSSEEEPGILNLVVGQKIDGLYRRYLKRSKKEIAYSSCVAIRRAAYEDAGGFDENFDLLDADQDFCIRIKKLGWKIAFSSELRAFHEGGGSPQRTSDRVLRAYKNRWYLLRKHGRIKHIALLRMMVLLRLRIEYLLLLVCGRLIFSDSNVVTDKLFGRRQLISYCKENYK